MVEWLMPSLDNFKYRYKNAQRDRLRYTEMHGHRETHGDTEMDGHTHRKTQIRYGSVHTHT